MSRSLDIAKVGFADSELLQYSSSGDELVILLKLWDERRVVVTFRGVSRVLCHASSWVAEFSEPASESSFLDAALSEVYETVPDSHPYRHYQFLGVEGESVIEVVAESVEASLQP
jgi:hypothetical protein